MTHLKRPWWWERLKAGGEGDDRGWDGWMASLTKWTWVWVDSGSWWWTGKPGRLRFMGSQRVGHTGLLNWTELQVYNPFFLSLSFFFKIIFDADCFRSLLSFFCLFVFYNIASFCFDLGFWTQGLWDHIPLPRDWSCNPCIGRWILIY